MNPLLFTLIGTVVVALVSLSGSFLLFLQEKLLQKISIFLVALASGALLGTAFLHLLPEVIESGEFPEHGFVITLAGFVMFYIAEKLLHLRHGKGEHQEHSPKSLGTLSLVGDSLHNFLDGLIIAAAFLVDIRLGMITTAAVALHEVPQEIAELGVLLYAGFSRMRALLLNFLSASTVILGGIVGFLLGDVFAAWTPLFLLFAVGTFFYVAAVDFLPEVKEERDPVKTVFLFLVFVLGIVLMWGLAFVE